MSDKKMCSCPRGLDGYHHPDCFEVYRANELRSGSPLESVVQGRKDSPAPLNPDVQGTPDILAKLRARAEQERDDAISFIHNMVRDKDLLRIVDITAGEIVAYARVVRWLDELGGCQSATQHEARS